MSRIKQWVILSCIIIGVIRGKTFLAPPIPYILTAVGAEAGNVEFHTANQQPTTRTVLSWNRDTFFTSLQAIPGDIKNNSILIKTEISEIQFRGKTTGARYRQPGSFNLLPVEYLGTEYLVSTCMFESDATNILTIATHDLEADVQIEFRTNDVITFQGVNYTDGEVLETHIEAFQTFSVSSQMDLSGTKVKSSNTVGLFVGKVLPRQDSIFSYTQLPPIRALAQKYLVVPNLHHTYTLKITGLQATTELTVKERSEKNVSMAESYRISVNDKELYFTASNPVLALMCSRSSEVVLPSMRTFSTESILFNQGQLLKVVTYKDNEVSIGTLSQRLSLPIKWSFMGTDISFKVGEFRVPENLLYSTKVFSEHGFGALVFDRFDNMMNGGLRVPDTDTEEVRYYNKKTEHTSTSTPAVVLKRVDTESSRLYSVRFLVIVSVGSVIIIALTISTITLLVHTYKLRRHGSEMLAKETRHEDRKLLLEEVESARGRRESAEQTTGAAENPDGQEGRNKLVELHGDGGREKRGGGREKNGMNSSRTGFCNVLFGVDPGDDDYNDDSDLNRRGAFSNKLYDVKPTMF